MYDTLDSKTTVTTVKNNPNPVAMTNGTYWSVFNRSLRIVVFMKDVLIGGVHSPMHIVWRWHMFVLCKAASWTPFWDKIGLSSKEIRIIMNNVWLHGYITWPFYSFAFKPVIVEDFNVWLTSNWVLISNVCKKLAAWNVRRRSWRRKPFT